MTAAAKPLDVLIAGAGPVGLTMATACRRFGLSFRIIDKLPQPSDKSKALVVWSGSLEMLAAMGLVEDFLAHSVPLDGVRLHDEGRQLAHINPVEGVDSRYPRPVLLPQSRTEALLTAHLYEHGVKVERPVEIVGLQAEGHLARCALRKGDGSTEEVIANYIAGCDGARSFVRHQLPVKFEGVTVETNFILVDAKVDGAPSHNEVFASACGSQTVAFFPVEGDVWRVFTQRPTLENKEPPTLEEMQAAVDRCGLKHMRLRDPTWLSCFQINERVTSRMRVGNVFLCGDAAHIHSPAGGQGMNTGMQDAYNLAWKIKLAREGVADPESVLESFHAERHAVAAGVVGGTGKLLRGVIAKHFLVRQFRNLAISLLTHLPAVQKLAAGKLSELGIDYAGSPLVDDSGPWPKSGGGFTPGTKPRDETVLDASGNLASLWAQTFAADYTLLYFSGVDPVAARAAEAEAVVAAARKLRPQINMVGVWQGYTPPAAAGVAWLRDTNARAHERYGVGVDSAWYLVRPDQFLAARAQPADIAALAKALRPVASRH